MRPSTSLAAIAAAVVGPAVVFAGPFDSIVGDALRIDAQVSSRTGSLVIPRSQLQQIPATLQWEWIGSTPLTVNSSDGFPLATITGRVVFDTQFDNILLDLNVLAAMNDVIVRVSTARLDDSFSSTLESLGVFASLEDANANGAWVSALAPETRLFASYWNGAPVLGALDPFIAPAGTTQSSMDAQQLVSPMLLGGKEVRGGFTLSASDRLTVSISSITAIPDPRGPLVLVIGGVWLARRRR